MLAEKTIDDEKLKLCSSFALYYSACRNWFDILADLINSGVDVNGFWNAETALCCACRRGHADVVELLLRKGANPYLHSALQKQSLPIQIACLNGDLRIAGLLLEHTAPYPMPTSAVATMDDYHVLHIAYDNGRWDIFELLQNSGFSAEITDKYGKTVLHKAVETDRIGRVQKILDLGVNVDLYDNCGMAALHYACHKGKSELADKLLRAGANPNLSTKVTIDGVQQQSMMQIPLCIAAKREDSVMVALLLKYNANVNLTDGSHRTALHYAIKAKSYRNKFDSYVLRGNNDLINRLHNDNCRDEYGEDFDCESGVVKSAQPTAAAGTHSSAASSQQPADVVTQLLDRYADVNIEDNKGQTPIYAAVKRQQMAVVQRMLRLTSANPNQTSSDRYPLCIACARNDTVLVKMLLVARADPNVIGEQYEGLTARTPLCIAAENRNVTVLDLLMDHGANAAACDWNGNNALNYLLECEDVDDDDISFAAIRLVQGGADPNQLTATRDVRPLYNLIGFMPFTTTSFLVKHMIRHGAVLDDSHRNIGRFRSNAALRLVNYLCPTAVLDNVAFALFQVGAGLKFLSANCEKNVDIIRNSSRCFLNICDTRLCRAVVLDGFRASDVDLRDIEATEVASLSSRDKDDFVQFVSWLAKERRCPPSLLRQSRTVIRRQLSLVSGRRTIFPLVDQLPLPSLLRQYVKYEGPLSEIDLTGCDSPPASDSDSGEDTCSSSGGGDDDFNC